MKKVEVLSPAGDLENFYTAIRAGADAVYFGLNKFNARMKADNISLENLGDVVSFAHLKGVKVYVTLNTLVTDKEMVEVVSMVGECLDKGVDAFIVQDYGIIGVLKNIYPDIVLHGSTQMGVHNVRGARVAKKLGLSRVVLSREVALDDILEISKNVDIELEVFVQGAMCVCFSGNCYLSSIKCGASGNRGECKQLCRLPYTLSCGNKSKYGYTISPRDNCMLEYLDGLISAGVVSLKIEGRLRRKGYVNIATQIYRDAVDELESKGSIENIPEKTNMLKKVFSRGEFIKGYFDGNDIIDTMHNNHMGELVGKTVSCKKFKDIYRIELLSCVEIHSGDGLKIISNGETITLGVGNIERSSKNYIVYGKNSIESGATVYRVLDSQFENKDIDKSRYIVMDLHFIATHGSPCKLIASANDINVEVSGDIPQIAKQRGLDISTTVEQLAKIGDSKEYLRVGKITCNIDENIFLPLSELNRLRRDVVERLKNEILSRKPCRVNRVNLESLVDSNESNDDSKALAIIDEKYDVKTLLGSYDGIILSPKVYSLGVLDGFLKRIKGVFDGNIFLNMPIIALKDDLKILDSMVELCAKNGIGIIANNIYAFDYENMGVAIWAGSNMNICNKYACSTLKSLGAKECIASIEKWCNPPSGLFKMCEGKRLLMTFAHCPSKTLTGKNCENGECGYLGDLKLKGDGVNYSIRRYRVSRCYFELVDSRVENKLSPKSIDDKRE